MMQDQKKLYKQIQTYSFVLYETALYLDTHPTCRPALAYYEKYRCRLREALEAYESQYGPMTIFTNQNTQCWDWVTEPWPWEIEC